MNLMKLRVYSLIPGLEKPKIILQAGLTDRLHELSMPQIEVELQRLKQLMLEMIGMVNTQMRVSINSLIEFDSDGIKNVLFHEKQVNALEIKIDKTCENIFALFHPVAIDLRFVFSTLRMNGNYERIGDNAVGISKYTLLNKKSFDPQLLKECRFHEMVECTYDMLDLITEAYQEQDIAKASQIFRRDMLLNEINAEVTYKIAGYIAENPGSIMEALHLLTIIRKIERVGDHITNVAEEILFYVEAKIVKHGKNIVEPDLN